MNHTKERLPKLVRQPLFSVAWELWEGILGIVGGVGVVGNIGRIRLRSHPSHSSNNSHYSHSSHCYQNKIAGPCGSAILFLKVGYLLAVNFLHVSDEIEHLVRVADFVVVPRYNLNEVFGEVNTGVGVEDRSAGIAEEVA